MTSSNARGCNMWGTLFWEWLGARIEIRARKSEGSGQLMSETGREYRITASGRVERWSPEGWGLVGLRGGFAPDPSE